MPLNKKGKKIKKAMVKQYGKKKGEKVFYAMESSGKLKKVIKARGGDAARSDAASGRSAGRADPSGGVDRSAVGAGSQYSRNKAKAALEAQRKRAIARISPSTTPAGKAIAAGIGALTGLPFGGYQIGKRMVDYSPMAFGVPSSKKKDKVKNKMERASEVLNIPTVPTAEIITPIKEKKIQTKLASVSPAGEFGYSVGFKKGGMLRQGKPKLAKKGWK